MGCRRNERTPTATTPAYESPPPNTSPPSAGYACETVPITIDLKAMLDRVVAEVFDENFTVEDATASGDALRRCS